MSALSRSARKLFAAAVTGLLLTAPLAAHAWWQDAYTQRTRITLNTSAAGVATQEALSGVAVPLRLHSGNFDFLSAKPDGSDLRVVAGDDKTPLKFRIERYDDANQMAVLWVQLPSVAPGSDKNTVYVYAGNDKAAAEAAAPVYDGSTLAAFSFGERDGLAADHTGALKLAVPATPEANGLIGPALRLVGTAVEWPASERVKAAAGAPYTVSLWAKPEGGEGVLFEQGALRIGLSGGSVAVTLGAAQVAGGALPPGAWAHVGVVVGAGKLLLYVNGASAGEAALPATAVAIEGPLRVGAGFNGLVDELEVIGGVRSADWMAFTRAVQGGDAKLVASTGETSDSVQEEGGEAGYIGILVKNLTIDAKIVIGILAVMFAIAVWVMISKAIFVGGIDKQNRKFLKGFRDAADVMVAEGVDVYPGSSLARLYAAGLRELQKRNVRIGGPALGGASIDAMKAAVDADLVRESHRLNNQMVLLTIAISGGPFLGLLGTVVGVMITFAAIAAAGDVNVNAIAPGIAAALLATVAGLGVAIPALFGYNYLAARIKNVSADMQIFVDEFVTRVAESYGAR